MSLRGISVGFLGIGRMGSMMAQNLLNAGASLVVCDKDAEALANVCRQPRVTLAESPAHLASTPGLEAVVSMLPTPQAVREAYLGKDGLLSVQPGDLHSHVLIDSSTIDPVTAKDVALAAEDMLLNIDAARSKNRQYAYMIDAPVSGGVAGAQSGTLTFMCGGSEEAVAAAKPILRAMGKSVVHCGPHGAGQAAKLANNLVLAVTMVGLAEGLEFGRRLGLDPTLLTSIFNNSSAHCWASEKYCPVPGVQEGVPSSRGYKGGFSSSLMVKDLTLAIESAKNTGAPMPMSDFARSMYDTVAQAESPPLDFSAVYKYCYAKMNTREE